MSRAADELEKFEKALEQSYFERYQLPGHVWGGIRSYVMLGIKPGHFLTHLFEGNLFGLYAHVDAENSVRVADFIQWIYNHAPSLCWGSPSKVEAWCNGGGYEVVRSRGE